MRHPSVEALLAGSEDVASHLFDCAICRELLRAMGKSAPETLPPLPGLMDVDRALYTDFQELREGRGGMGRAFRARDRRLDRIVVIKQPLDGESRAKQTPRVATEVRRRFEREAKLTARLEHPSIVGVHEAGRFQDGEPFYAMRSIDGITLDEAIARRRDFASRLELLESARVLADALSYAHEQQIVHRDVKPRNVLLGPFGETVLIDWGLAKDLAAEDHDQHEDIAETPTRGVLTELGVGTPHYMPPEQARGDRPTTRMDVYALGATLYHLLSGVPPYAGLSAVEARKKLREEPPRPLREVTPEVPAPLAAIVDRAMARDPRGRFSSAREVAAELRRFQTGQLTLSHRHTPGDLLVHFARRYRATLQTSAIALAVIVSLAIVGFVRVLRERDRADAARRRAELALESARGVEASHLATSPQDRLKALFLGVQAIGPSIRAGVEPPREALQGLVDAATAGPAFATLHGIRGGEYGVDLSPDGRSAAVVSEDGTIRIFDTRSARELSRMHSTLRHAFYVRYASDARHLLVWGFEPNADICQISGTCIHLSTKTMVIGASFLPNGNFVTVADAVVVWDLEGREISRADIPSSVTCTAFARSSETIAIGLENGSILLGNAAVGFSRTIAAHRDRVLALALSPDGRTLVSTGRDGRALRHELTSSAPPEMLLDDPSVMLSPHVALSPDGRVVTLSRGLHDGGRSVEQVVLDLAHPGIVRRFGGWVMTGDNFARGGAWLLSGSIHDVSLRDSRTGGEVLRLDTVTEWPGGASAIEDEDGLGRILVSGGFEADGAVYDVRNGAASGLLLGHSAEIRTLSLDGSASHLVSASLDGSARVWSAKTGELLATFRSSSPLTHASWMPNGDVLTAGFDGVARRFRMSDEAPRVSYGEAGAPLSIALITPSGDDVITAAVDGALSCWDAESGALRLHFANVGSASTAAILANGSLLATGHGDGKARVWDVSRATLVATIETDSTSGISSIHVTPDGDRLVLGISSGRSVIVDATDFNVVSSFPGRPASSENPFDGSTSRLATVTPDGHVLVRDLSQITGPIALDGHLRIVLASAFSPSGDRLATADLSGAVRVWDPSREDAPLLSIDTPRLGAATALVFSPDGESLFVGYSSGALRMHPLTPGAALARACSTMSWLGVADTDGHCETTRTSRNAAHER